MDKILVKVYVPMLEEIYDVWIPSHKRIHNVVVLLVKAINELNDNCYRTSTMPTLYNKLTAEPYDFNLKVKDTTIRSGLELVLL